MRKVCRYMTMPVPEEALPVVKCLYWDCICTGVVFTVIWVLGSVAG